MLRERSKQLARAWMAIDIAVAAAAFIGLLVHPRLQPALTLSEIDPLMIASIGAVAVLGWPLSLMRCGVYRTQRRKTIGHVALRIGSASLLMALGLSTIAFLTRTPIPPAFPIAFASVLFLAQLTLQFPTRFVLQSVRRAGANYRNIVIVGSGPRALEALETIERKPEWGLSVRGFIDDCENGFESLVPAERVHKMVEAPRLLRESTIDEVLVACPRSMLGDLSPLVHECAMIGVPVTLLMDLFGADLPVPEAGSFDSSLTLSFAPVHHSEIALLAKRGVDIGGALLGLALAAPVVMAAAVAIRVTSPGPIFFQQIRSGRNGRPFRMLKLRTMVADAESQKAELLHLNEMDGPVFKIRRDPRVTPVGAALRRWSIDELPQFWNVLMGDMSLVGPRPPTPDEVVQYRGEDRRRLSMRPGLTCLWQVSGRNEVSFDEWMKLDIAYIDNWSFGTDLRILIRTVPQILLGRGAS